MLKSFFRLQAEEQAVPKIFATQNLAFYNSPLAPPFDSIHKFLANSERR
jgi:hypothetical protein